MPRATMTSKGQVTVPAEIRKALSLEPGDQLQFTLLPDGTVLLRARNVPLRALKGLVKADRGARVRIEDMSFGTA
jgi:AbrB family looped-hinge helix DNA binding protein